MSVINKMLQDLDRRQALGTTAEAAVVRASTEKSRGHEWFWRVLVLLLTGALVWMGWVAVQLLPRKGLVTELAFQAASDAQTRIVAKPAAVATTPSRVTDPAAPPSVTAAPAEEPKPAATPPAGDALRLAVQLETPVLERQPVPETQPLPEKPAAAPEKAEPPKPVSLKPKPVPPPAAKATVDKRDRAPTAAANAEAHFRRAAMLLSHGRVSEAEEQLSAALRADGSHAAARQAYVALLLEQQRVDAARRLLQEALAANPEQPTFALALARVHAGQRDYLAALEVMDRAGPAGANSDFQAMRGAVLQRLARHGEAVEAYENALRGGAQAAPTTWVGLGISLESLGRRSEAARAYRRALAAGPIAPEAREYAENRARALE